MNQTTFPFSGTMDKSQKQRYYQRLCRPRSDVPGDLLRRRHHHRNLLSPHLSGPEGPVRSLPLLPDGWGSSGGRVSALPEMSPSRSDDL